VNGRVLPDSQGREWDEARAILVGLGNVKEEVFDSADAARTEQGSAPRPDAFHVLDIRIETEHGD
jgi:hypothetical protein